MDNDGDDDVLSLQIAPSFKSRSSGRGSGSGGSSSKKAGSSRARPSPSLLPSTAAGTVAPEGAGGLPASSSSTNIRFQNDENEDEDEGNSSAVLFRKSNKAGKARSSGIGAASSSSSSSSRKIGQSSSNNRSKLNMSFGPDRSDAFDDTQNDENMEGPSSAVIRGTNNGRAATSKFKRAPGLAGARLASSSITTSADRNLSSSMSQASLSSAGPSYSKEDLAQLVAANTAAPSSSTINGASSNSNGYDSLTMSKFGRYSTDPNPDSSVIAETLLPSESAIASAKARRETARKSGVDGLAGNSDFVSLEVGHLSTNSKRESRLVREEDEIGEGEDDHAAYTGAEERVPLGRKGRQALEAQRRAELRGLIDGDADDADENGSGLLGGAPDEEEQEWELAQIRRGAAAQQQRSHTADAHAPYRAAAIPEPLPALPSLSSTAARLQAALADARLAKSDSDALLAQAERERMALDAQEAELRAEVDRVSSKYEWFIEFKDWVEEVASFLDEKVGILQIAAMKESEQRADLTVLCGPVSSRCSRKLRRTT